MTDDTRVAGSARAGLRASSTSKDLDRRRALLASIIALAAAVFVLIVFGIGRMPLPAKHVDSANMPELRSNTDPPMRPSGTGD